LGKSLPFVVVIGLAVMLVGGIVSLMDSIPDSIREIYAYSKDVLVLGPRSDPDLTPKLLDIVKKESPVPIDRYVMIRGASTIVHSIVGKWPFTFIGFNQADMPYFLHRNHVATLAGRLPNPGAPEAVITEPVARNLHVHLGSVIMNPKDLESYSPIPVKVVGIAQTDRWFMFGDIDFLRANFFPPIDVAIVFARNETDQRTLGRWAEKRFKGTRAAIYTYEILERDTNDMFSILYKILDIVIALLVVVITFMMAMLMNIYLSQRLVEFGLLQALGYTKRQLLRRVWRESLVVVCVGWLVGAGGAFGILRIAYIALMYPRAYALNPTDPLAFRYTIPIPIAILAVAVLTLAVRFRRFDPVNIVERRLV
jgi:ABC-type lipoprotein release transport system permease subunit